MKKTLSNIFLYFRNLCNVISKKNTVKGLSLKYLVGGGKYLTISGKNNKIINKCKHLGDVRIVMYGNNHTLVIEENVVMKQGLLWFEDEGCSITIGKGTTIESAQMAVAEQATSITIGEDCMLSSDIRIATTDSHSIIDMASGKRTNQAASISVGNHAWIGTRVAINKGVTIADDVVVAGNSVVTHDAPSHTIIAGTPAKVIKDNTTWNRQRI